MFVLQCLSFFDLMVHCTPSSHPLDGSTSAPIPLHSLSSLLHQLSAAPQSERSLKIDWLVDIVHKVIILLICTTIKFIYSSRVSTCN